MRHSLLPTGPLPLVLQPESAAEAPLPALLDWLEARRGHWRPLLHKHGGILLRGFAVEGPADFHAVAERAVWPGTLAPYLGGDAPRGRVQGLVYNSTETPADQPIPAHNEKSYSADHPATILFYCEREPTARGETPLADGRRLLRRLSPATLEAFRAGVTYIQNLRDESVAGVGRSWQSAFETADKAAVEARLRALGAGFRWRADGGLYMEETTAALRRHPASGEAVFFSQADQWHCSTLDPVTRAAALAEQGEYDLNHAARFGDGRPMLGPELDELRAAIVAECVAFPWRRGDVLLLDNLLTLHGRAPFAGPRRVLVAMA